MGLCVASMGLLSRGGSSPRAQGMRQLSRAPQGSAEVNIGEGVQDPGGSLGGPGPPSTQFSP